jgi:alpha-1,3-mannosyl-glycoprotein beta-1,2-N-acetylglucosaminyltransferase
MLVAPDFFSMMQATAPVLHADPSLMCVSAWNDNGLKGVVSAADSADELRRTSVFPGLGWMLTRRLWEELRDKWPAAFWDDWLREANQTRGRDCLYPAVCRSKTIGKIGSSAGQFFERYLARIILNSQPVDWTSVSFAPLARSVYRQQLLARVAAARTVSRGAELAELLEQDAAAETAVRIFWDGPRDYKRLADQLGLMNDLKEGLPRSSLEGIVRLHVGVQGKISLFLVPASLRGSHGIPGTPPRGD